MYINRVIREGLDGLSLTREALPADVAEGAPGVVGDVPLVRLRHPGRGRGRRSPVAFDCGLQSISQFPSGDLHPLTNHFLLILPSLCIDSPWTGGP